MPWQDDNKGPWGRPGGPNRDRDQSFEELKKKGQEKLKNLVPGGKGSGFFVGIVIFFFVALWVSRGIYFVQEGEQACEMLFGKYTSTTSPGPHLWWPSPIGDVIVKKVSHVNRVDSGVKMKSNTTLVGDNADSLMLTGDENIVSVNFTVLWFIKDLPHYVFNDPNPDSTVKLAAESAVREIIAQYPIATALTVGRAEIADKAQKLMQQMIDDYQIGIQIQEVRLQSVDPPSQVIDAFRDVQRARADRESSINDARAYNNTIIPEARGSASQILQRAEGYRQATVAEAQGQALRFEAVLKQYLKAPEITKKRIYIDTMKMVLKGTNKVLIDQKSQGVLPFMSMPEFKPKPQTPEAPAESVRKTSGAAQIQGATQAQGEALSFGDMRSQMKREVK